MRNRFSRMGKPLLGAMCLLSTCGLTYSCSDDYDLDETMPSFLGGSIYDELKARNFNTTVRLIDDLNYTDVLSRTGSKTLFVAPDSAYDSFFATTTWTDGTGNPVRSYEQLSAAQKRQLLYGSMLNNADVLEMLPYSSGGGTLTMRRTTAASAVDSVTYWKWNELPDNQNEPGEDSEGNATGDSRFWDKYRTQARGGMYMALDGTAPMMVHFIEDQLKEKNVTHEDIGFIMNDPWANGSSGGNRTYVYDARINEDGRDVTCLNGYFNILNKVLVTPPNMAEVIRTNGSTNLFSRMLDRFSAPYYNASLTASYRALYDIGNDSVFEKRYISSRSADGAITVDPNNQTLGNFPFLTYDPGWNQYAVSSSVPKEQDMGAMFVPSDEAMKNYFLQGAGYALLQRYATKEINEANLEYNLYQIPLDIMQALINNLMKDSFLESVPSKYQTIMNDAQDQMFSPAEADFATVDKYKESIEKCLLANNGIVYVMNRVISPADYASVIAPVLYQRNTTVVRAVVRADENYIEGSQYNNAPLQRYYSTYLKAMQSRFSLFVPTDEGLNLYGYVDPMSLARGTGQRGQWKYWRFTYKNMSGAIIPIKSQAYSYDVTTGQKESDRQLQGASLNTSEPNGSLTGSNTGKVKKTLLIDMIDQHIVVHDTEDADNDAGVNSNRTYYISRGGAPVYVANKGDQSNKGKGMLVDGGYQLQLKNDDYPDNDHDCTVTEGFDQTSETNGGYGNGMTYLLDRPMQPTTNSVFGVLKGDADHYSDFFNMCDKAYFTSEELEMAGFRTDEMTGNTSNAQNLWNAEQRKYRIFTDASENMIPQNGEMLVRFFNNYRYTIYAPTNAAIAEAKAKGLKDHDEIATWMQDNAESGVLSAENQEKAQAMIVMLFNFLKYHFQDQSLFVDHVNVAQTEYQTSCIDNDKNIYLGIKVKQSDNAISVTDNAGDTQDVVAPYNVLARDASFDVAPTQTATQIKNSSYVVIHQVNHALKFASLPNDRYDSAWSTDANAKAFVKRYKLR